MSSPVCVDASFVIRTLVPDSFTEHAIALLAGWRYEKVTLVAPALLAFEVTSTLRRYVHFNRIAPSQGERAFSRFLQMDIRLSHRRGIFPVAWKLAEQFQRPTAYDTVYLALAQMSNCQFWTADKRLYNAVHHELAWVEWIGNYSSGSNGQNEQPR